MIGNYNNHTIYIDINELSWGSPIPETAIPKVNDEIKAVIISPSHRHDAEFLGSVRFLAPENNPWHDPLIYKIGDEFIGEIESVNNYGCWAVHPKGADVRLLIDGVKAGLKKGQKLTIRIVAVNEKHRSIDGEIVKYAS